MGVDRGVVALVDLAEPFGQDTVERHGDQDAGHADIAVVHDLVRVEDIADADDQDDDGAAGDGDGDDIGPQVETVDRCFGDQRPVTRSGHIHEFRASQSLQAGSQQGEQQTGDDQRPDHDDSLVLEGAGIFDLAVLLGGVGSPLQGGPGDGGNQQGGYQADGRFEVDASSGDSSNGSLDEILRTAGGHGKGIHALNKLSRWHDEEHDKHGGKRQQHGIPHDPLELDVVLEAGGQDDQSEQGIQDAGDHDPG